MRRLAACPRRKPVQSVCRAAHDQAKRAMLDTAQPATVRWLRDQFSDGGTFPPRTRALAEGVMNFV
jgi:hypothetical protein